MKTDLISTKTLLLIMLCLAVVIIFNYMMWQNYAEIQRLVARFGDEDHFVPEAGTAAADDEENFQVALITSGGQQRVELIREGASRAASSRGLELKFYEADPAGQLSASDYLELVDIADFDGVLLEGASGDLTEEINALDDGLPVVTINADYPDSSRLSYVGLDHHQAGFQIGRYLLNKSEGGEIYALVDGSRAGRAVSTSEQLKIFGLQEAFAAAGSQDRLRIREVEPDLLELSEKMREILSEDGAEVIFSPGEEITLMLAEAAIPKGAGEDIFTAGYGSRSGLAGEVSGEEFDALIYHDSRQIGYQAVEEMAAILARGSVNLHSRVDMEIVDPEAGEISEVSFDDPPLR